jgi:hypothetical protein
MQKVTNSVQILKVYKFTLLIKKLAMVFVCMLSPRRVVAPESAHVGSMVVPIKIWLLDWRLRPTGVGDVEGAVVRDVYDCLSLSWKINTLAWSLTKSLVTTNTPIILHHGWIIYTVGWSTSWFVISGLDRPVHLQDNQLVNHMCMDVDHQTHHITFYCNSS